MQGKSTNVYNTSRQINRVTKGVKNVFKDYVGKNSELVMVALGIDRVAVVYKRSIVDKTFIGIDSFLANREYYKKHEKDLAIPVLWFNEMGLLNYNDILKDIFNDFELIKIVEDFVSFFSS